MLMADHGRQRNERGDGGRCWWIRAVPSLEDVRRRLFCWVITNSLFGMGGIFSKRCHCQRQREITGKVGKISNLNGIELSIDPPLINDGTRLIDNEPDYLKSPKWFEKSQLLVDFVDKNLKFKFQPSWYARPSCCCFLLLLRLLRSKLVDRLTSSGYIQTCFSLTAQLQPWLWCSSSIVSVTGERKVQTWTDGRTTDDLVPIAVGQLWPRLCNMCTCIYMSSLVCIHSTSNIITRCGDVIPFNGIFLYGVVYINTSGRKRITWGL